MRRDFFDVGPKEPFCRLPDNTGNTTMQIPLPPLDAIVGNPPYVKQEKIGRPAKEKMARVVVERWPGTKLSGRSDAHCYFWPAAAYFLKEGGYFGFLTSSSWLDAEYGFLFQRWILENFRIIAICESEAEPWFEDARVKTCATVLQRCADVNARLNSLAKFVQFKIPLAQVISETAESSARFAALNALRSLIEEGDNDFEDSRLQLIVKRQEDLWQEGVRAIRFLPGPLKSPEGESGEDQCDNGAQGHGFVASERSRYAGGKWGRYVRAPILFRRHARARPEVRAAR